MRTFKQFLNEAKGWGSADQDFRSKGLPNPHANLSIEQKLKRLLDFHTGEFNYGTISKIGYNPKTVLFGKTKINQLRFMIMNDKPTEVSTRGIINMARSEVYMGIENFLENIIAINDMIIQSNPKIAQEASEISNKSKNIIASIEEIKEKLRKDNQAEWLRPKLDYNKEKELEILSTYEEIYNYFLSLCEKYNVK